MNEFCLKNGLRLIIDLMPNTHSVSIGLYVKAGSRYESLDENGITHFLEHLFFRKLGNLSQQELYYRMESIGSTLRASTYKDMLRFYMKIRPDYLNECVEIFKNFFTTSTWTEEEFEREKTVVLNQIAQRDSYTKIEPYIYKTVWGDSPLSYEIMGNSEVVSQMSIQQLTEYKSRIMNANNMLICITGCINGEQIDAIKAAFECLDIPRGIENRIESPFVKIALRHPDITIAKVNWDYLDVNLSFDLDYNDTFLFEINMLSTILSEGVGSRLPVLIREELGYTAEIYSEIESYEDTAVLHIRFNVHKKLFYDCLRSIIKALNKMKIDIQKRDLDISLPFYTENLMFSRDDSEETNLYNGYDTLVINQKNVSNDLRNNSETINRFRLLSKKFFCSQCTSLVVLGDCSRITKKKIKEILMQLDEKA